MPRTRTNFKAAKELKEFYESNDIERGFITKEQKEQIESICEIYERSILELHDLRDFVVIFLSNFENDAVEKNEFKRFEKISDCISAVTHVIDIRLFELESR